MNKQIRKSKPALTIPDLVVLSLLSERPMHGYELVKEYLKQEVSDWAAVSRPHVYYALKKLAALKYISPKGTDKNENRVVYAPTPTGRNALSDALSENSWSDQRPPTPFLTWLGLSIHARSDEAMIVLSSRRKFLLKQIEKETMTLSAIEMDQGMRSSVAAHMVRYVIQQFRLELDLIKGVETNSFKDGE